MRKIIISFCILFAALSLQAQSVNGIRIDGGNTPILVYLGGNQISLPTTTCFIANLNPGHYTVEVYATRFTRPGERVWKGEKLYKDYVYFDGRGVKEIWVDGRDNMHPERPDRPGQGGHRPGQGEHRPGYGYNRVMNDQLRYATHHKIRAKHLLPTTNHRERSCENRRRTRQSADHQSFYRKRKISRFMIYDL